MERFALSGWGRLIKAVFVLVGVLWCGHAALATPYASPDGRWSFEIPTGWQVAPDADLRVVSDEAARAATAMGERGAPNYVLLIRPVKADGRFALVQRESPLPAGVSYDALKAGIKQQYDGVMRKIEQAAPNAGASAAFGKPVFDDTRRRLVSSMSLSTADGMSLKAVSVSNWGKQETINVHAYSPVDMFDANRPMLVSIGDSFQFSPQCAYDFDKEGAGAGAAKFGRGIAYLIIGGIVVIFYLIKRAVS